jgi:hypothetical protein
LHAGCDTPPVAVESAAYDWRELHVGERISTASRGSSPSAAAIASALHIEA